MSTEALGPNPPEKRTPDGGQVGRADKQTTAQAFMSDSQYSPKNAPGQDRNGIFGTFLPCFGPKCPHNPLETPTELAQKTWTTPDELARHYADFWQAECHRLRAALETAIEHADYWLAIASLAEMDGDE